MKDSRIFGIDNGAENEERKVIVPVAKSKLQKLLIFYAMKKNYPKFVDQFLKSHQTEENISYTSPPHLEDGSSESDTSPPHLEDGSSDNISYTSPPHLEDGSSESYTSPPHLEDGSSGNISYTSPPHLEDGSREDKMDQMMTSLMKKEIEDSKKTKESNNLNVDSKYIDDKKTNQELDGEKQSKNTNENRNLNVDVKDNDDKMTDKESNTSNERGVSHANNNDTVKHKKKFWTENLVNDTPLCAIDKNVKCIENDLGGLFASHYDDSFDKTSTEVTAATRAPADPYATIGHMTSMHDNEEGHHIDHEG